MPIYNTYGGVTSAGAQTPQMSYAPQQNQAYADAAARRTQEKQDQLNQDEVTRNQLLSQSRASDALYQMMNDPNNYQETDGTNINVNNGGGAGGRASSGSTGTRGVAIGGGIYPNISDLMGQIKNASPQVTPPPQVPQPTVPGSPDQFAHAKDVAGRQGNKAIEALNNYMTRRGLSDSGMAAAGAADILGGVGRQAAQAEYDRANIDSGRQWEANKLGYAGNMSQNQMGYQGGITQRGQDIDALFNLLRTLY